MKKPRAARKVALPSLETTSLRKGQEFTSKVWAKHTSKIMGPDSYSSVITRIPLGRVHFNHVACSTAMRVTTEPNNRSATLFLPLDGSMNIKVEGKPFRAAPGLPMLLPHRTAMEFSATPIECLLIEIPAKALLGELKSHGAYDDALEPLDWGSGEDAVSLVCFLEFLSADLMGALTHPSPHHLRRMEGLLLSILAQAIVADRPIGALSTPMIGRMKVEELCDWIGERLTTDLAPARIAAKTGITPRSLQKAFLRHYHTTLTSYLLDLRLEALRKELLESRKPGGISEIALRYQFHHLGRFSQAYRKQFGELPSVSLARRLGKVSPRGIQKNRSSRGA
jgi:AraC-like DNA-binding protein